MRLLSFRTISWFHKNRMAATIAATTSMMATETNIHHGGGNTVICRPQPHAMARSHVYALLACALALPASLLWEGFFVTLFVTMRRRITRGYFRLSITTRPASFRYTRYLLASLHVTA
jgi:hypothetical protein